MSGLFGLSVGSEIPALATTMSTVRGGVTKGHDWQGGRRISLGRKRLQDLARQRSVFRLTFAKSLETCFEKTQLLIPRGYIDHL